MSGTLLAVFLVTGFVAMLWGLLSKAHGSTGDESSASAPTSCQTMFLWGLGIVVVIGFVIFAGCGAAMGHH